jgi:hypothetical protein
LRRDNSGVWSRQRGSGGRRNRRGRPLAGGFLSVAVRQRCRSGRPCGWRCRRYPIAATRNVSWFDRAPRYHTGGVVGLAANEQAAILQRGEEVLTADNPRNMRNVGRAAPPDINIRNVLVADPDMVPQHMASSRGEKVIMSTLTRNAATVRQLVR